MSLCFKFDGLPPSYNVSFKINYSLRQVYLTKEVREFKTRVKLSMPVWEFPEGALFAISVFFHYAWYYKNKKPRRLDIQNLDKLLIDAIFDKLGCDDSRLWMVRLYKVHTEEAPYTEVKLDTL